MRYEDLPDVLTIPEVAKFLQIGITKAYEMSHWRGFPAIRIGRAIRIPKKALMEWLEQLHKQEQAPMLKAIRGR